MTEGVHVVGEPTTCRNCYAETEVCETCGLCEDCHDHPFMVQPSTRVRQSPGDGPPYDAATATGMYDRGDIPE